MRNGSQGSLVPRRVRQYLQLTLIVALALAGTTVSADSESGLPSDLPAPLLAKLDLAREACAGFGGGYFSLLSGAVSRVDLDGDQRPDWVINERHFACSSAASLYAGTGGSLSHFLVDDAVFSLLNQGWEMRSLGANSVLLAEVHGALCDAYGYIPCVTASMWDAEHRVWRSAAAPWEP